jgi:2-oxoglutarate dehydrogenase E2 component (dihydrolipoamide succinyltransferase)
MTRLRQRVSQRLKESQNTNAMLTTFNEIDMSGFMSIRKELGDVFAKKHGVKLGFMSAFVRASAAALKDQPIVNAVIDGNDIVYRDFVDISVAVATPTGLVVPVLRNCQNLGYADIEKVSSLLKTNHEHYRISKTCQLRLAMVRSPLRIWLVALSPLPMVGSSDP